jgi:hypothetical protein
VNVSYADAHVSFITNDIASATWKALSTMNGAETVEVQ